MKNPEAFSNSNAEFKKPISHEMNSEIVPIDTPDFGLDPVKLKIDAERAAEQVVDPKITRGFGAVAARKLDVFDQAKTGEDSLKTSGDTNVKSLNGSSDIGGYYDNKEPGLFNEALGLVDDPETEDLGPDEKAEKERHEALKAERDQKAERLKQAREEYDQLNKSQYEINALFEDARRKGDEAFHNLKAGLFATMHLFGENIPKLGEEIYTLQKRIDEIEKMLIPKIG